MAERLATPLRWHPFHGLLLLLAIGITLLLPWWFGGRGTMTMAMAFPPSLLLLMAVIAVLCWNLNAARLRLMLAGRAGHLGQGGALSIEMSAKFALCATPGGTGGAATLLWLLARRGYSPSRASAIFLVDQGCDMLFFTLMLTLLLGVALGGTSQWPHQALIEIALPGLVMAILALALIIAFLPHLLRRRPWLHWPGPRRRRWVVRRLLRCRHALVVTLRLPRHILIAIFLLCCIHWLLRYSLLYLAVLGVSGHADWAWTFLVQMLAMAASQLSILPGGAGAAEVSVGALLLPIIDREQAAAAIVIWRLVSYHLYLVAGAPVFALSVSRLLSSRKGSAVNHKP
ncbi:lysylphosphatidylglycerol synthase transmembrane domain-containing protein [Halomonas huangheensis]|nr:lysylphosphatidylglycerol synthase transmembrane domain-containing protein [Halomonas huangheensis]ALM54550.1 hypothetical protein AR456_05785 [Halomonas huangheensis]